MGWLYWRFVDRRKLREQAHLANAGENLTCQIWRNSQSLQRAHRPTFVDRGNWRIKSPSVLLTLEKRKAKHLFSDALVSQFLHRIKKEMYS